MQNKFLQLNLLIHTVEQIKQLELFKLSANISIIFALYNLSSKNCC